MFQITKKKFTVFDDKLSLGLAALLFSAGLFYLYNDKFHRINFCLMNGNDPYCEDYRITSCFNKDTSVLANNFDFGGFIEVDSGFGYVYVTI